MIATVVGDVVLDVLCTPTYVGIANDGSDSTENYLLHRTSRLGGAANVVRELMLLLDDDVGISEVRFAAPKYTLYQEHEYRHLPEFDEFYTDKCTLYLTRAWRLPIDERHRCVRNSVYVSRLDIRNCEQENPDHAERRLRDLQLSISAVIEDSVDSASIIGIVNYGKGFFHNSDLLSFIKPDKLYVADPYHSLSVFGNCLYPNVIVKLNLQQLRTLLALNIDQFTLEFASIDNSTYVRFARKIIDLLKFTRLRFLVVTLGAFGSLLLDMHKKRLIVARQQNKSGISPLISSGGGDYFQAGIMHSLSTMDETERINGDPVAYGKMLANAGNIASRRLILDSRPEYNRNVDTLKFSTEIEVLEL